MGFGLLIFFCIITIIVALLQSRANQRNRKWEWEEHKNHNRQLLESVTQMDRGTWSERDLILELLKYGFKSGALFHDLYLKKYNGQHNIAKYLLIMKNSKSHVIIRTELKM